MHSFHALPFRPALLGVAISAVLAGPAAAEETTSYFDEVLVWGTEVTSNTDTLHARDMSLKQADHMSDLLRDIPGVDVGGTHSVNQRINIRGLGETDLDIRLDGASQHANMFHHVGNLTLNPDILKSANIQVGNNSVTQSGLGGAVYFETKDAGDLLRPDERFGARAFTGYQSNDSRQGSLTLYGQLTDSVDAMVYGHGISRGNFKDGDGNTTIGADGDTYNVLAKVGVEPADGHRFELSYDLYRDSGDYSPRADMGGSANQALSAQVLVPTDYNRDTITLGYELDGDNHDGKVTLYTSRTELVRDESVFIGSGVGWPGDRLSENKAENRNTGVNVLLSSNLRLLRLDNQLNYGLEYLHKNTESHYGGVQFMDESADSRAVFAENTLFITDTLSLTGGLRHDDYRRKATTGTHDFDDVTWSLGAEWQVTPDWTLFANARSLFKGPELLESFVKYQDVTVLADDLRPETGLNTQGGVRFARHLGEHRLGATATLFRTEIDDYIGTNWQGSGYVMENIADVEIDGFELSASYGFGNFNGKLSYARSDTTDKATGGPVAADNGRSMDVGDSLALSLDYQAERLETIFGLTSILVRDEDNVFAGTPIKEGYDVHNIYAQWVPSAVDGLSLTVGIDNLFDETYTSHASRSGTARGAVLNDFEPGRNVKISAAYQF
ncbi:TonB-dependent siderophore receptor [Oceanimonas sp. MB9]|uniref:TonB-dependent siderophore receptor n=1 Tax=Oceanimonas sp. MB9 TaxID=2588453 RepID=UPI0013F6031B|nr:TonB-dependent siderophore receptor [Oceanimonas sp. MB9]NHH99555.1 Heme transporter BhuA [Oceanimonas sp. MB9]